MKILMMISHFFPAGVGGAERQCLRQAKALVERGHEVMIVTKWLSPDSARYEEEGGVHVWRRGCYFSIRKLLRARVVSTALESKFTTREQPVNRRERMVSSQSNGQASAEWLRNLVFMADLAWGMLNGRLKADVIHVHESHWIAGFARWMGNRMGIPVFCKEAFQPVLLFDAEGMVPWIRRWDILRRNCHFIAMTDGIAKELAAFGISKDQIVHIPNGVELPRELAVPRRYGDAICVGNFSQGAAHKGFDVLLRAWGMVHRQEAGVKLRLYGRGDPAVWKAFTIEQGCEDSVVFEGETDDIWTAHRRSGFIVVPSRREGLSNALLEAMASGLPSVVSDIPGNTAAVRNDQEGIVVPVGDAEALAEAILKLYRDPEMRGRMGRAARIRAEETFAIGKVAERLEQAYRDSIDAGKP